ncbi:MAG: nucleotidyltransferase family protein [bacterium]|nr:nucleotidyltransferase family protein [bacterium]
MIAGVVLAAGDSSRLGRPKQLLRHRGSTLLRNAADACVRGGCRPVVVVLGFRAAEMRPELSGLPVRVVENPEWASGMASSIRAAIRVLESEVSDAEAVVLAPCDQPALDSYVIRRVCRAFDGSRSAVVGCEYAQTIGPPALFERSLFDRLGRLTGDSGAKALLQRPGALLTRVDWPEGAWDVDRPDDLRDP